jgi:hypothetical protein
LLAETPVDIKVAVKREDRSDIKPLGEAHQGEISDPGIVLWKQVVLSSQHSGLTWITKQLEHLSDANR